MKFLTVAATLILVVAIALAVLPQLLLTDLPNDLNFNLPRPTTMIVTGANGGLGLATVQKFAHNPRTTIIMACRNMAKCLQAKNTVTTHLGRQLRAKLLPMQLDLSRRNSIEAFARESDGMPIDILIQNAGFVGTHLDLVYHSTDSDGSGIESHVNVNHLGTVYLTHCLWPNLQKAPNGGRVVVVSSIVAALSISTPTVGWFSFEKNQIGWPHNFNMYARSKRATLMFAHELHTRYFKAESAMIRGSVSVVAAHPGFSHTQLCQSGCQGDIPAWLRQIMNLEFLVGLVKSTPDDGALPQALAAVLPPEHSGSYIGPSLVLLGDPKIVGTQAGSWHHMGFTREESQQLWDQTMAALNITEFGKF